MVQPAATWSLRLAPCDLRPATCDLRPAPCGRLDHARLPAYNAGDYDAVDEASHVVHRGAAAADRPFCRAAARAAEDRRVPDVRQRDCRLPQRTRDDPKLRAAPAGDRVPQLRAPHAVQRATGAGAVAVMRARWAAASRTTEITEITEKFYT